MSIAIVTASLLALIFACTPPNKDGGSTTKLLLLGDSITSYSGYSQLIPVELGYEADQVVIHAFGGVTTRDFLPDGDNYRSAQVKLHAPTFATVLLGTNDAGPFFKIRANEYADNLRSLIEALQMDGAGTIVLIPPPHVFPRDRLNQSTNRRLALYAAEIESLCDANPDDNVECGPNLFTLLEEEDFVDGVHPNGHGYKLITTALVDSLNALSEQ